MYSFSYLEPVCCSMSSSIRCFLTCIQVSQEAGQVVWYSHLFHNFPQFIVIHTVKAYWLCGSLNTGWPPFGDGKGKGGYLGWFWLLGLQEFSFCGEQVSFSPIPHVFPESLSLLTPSEPLLSHHHSVAQMEIQGQFAKCNCYVCGASDP